MRLIARGSLMLPRRSTTRARGLPEARLCLRVRGIGQGDVQPAILDADGDGHEAAGDALGQEGECVRLGRPFAEVDRLQAKLLCHGVAEPPLLDEPQLDEQGADAFARGALLEQGFGELGVRQQLPADQDLAEPPALAPGGDERSGYLGRGRDGDLRSRGPFRDSPAASERVTERHDRFLSDLLGDSPLSA